MAGIFCFFCVLITGAFIAGGVAGARWMFLFLRG